MIIKKPTELSIQGQAAIAFHKAAMREVREDLPTSTASHVQPLPTQCFRDGCNSFRVKRHLFCSASCSKLHEEFTRATYHEKRAIKKRDAKLHRNSTQSQINHHMASPNLKPFTL